MIRALRGLSLVEVLATLFLFSIALAIISQLLVNHQQVIRFSRGQDRSMQAALVTLGELRDEVREALTLVAPNSSTSASTLELTRLVPGVARFPEPVPNVAPTGWTFLPATALVRIRYQVSGGALVRQIVSGLPAATYTIADGISALETSLEAGGNLALSMVVTEQQKSRTLKTTVYRFR